MDLCKKKITKTGFSSFLMVNKLDLMMSIYLFFTKSSCYVNHQNQKKNNILILILEVKNIIKNLINVRSLEEKQY